MITETKIIHECEFCRKWYKRKHAAEWHEKHCKNNPSNKHKCFLCKHLEVDDIESDDPYHSGRIGIMFTCKKNGVEMHTYVAERRRMTVAKETERMPVKCELFDTVLYGYNDTETKGF